MARQGVVFEFLGQLVAIQAGHHHVRQNQVGDGLHGFFIPRQAIERMKDVSDKNYETTKEWSQALLTDAQAIRDEDLNACKTMGKLGAELIPNSANVLTHCNAGALAFAGWGTALGVIRSAAEAGKKIHVYMDETRPYLQGARLTAWEMLKAKIPSTTTH